jgi:hypothetical protein
MRPFLQRCTVRCIEEVHLPFCKGKKEFALQVTHIQEILRMLNFPNGWIISGVFSSLGADPLVSLQIIILLCCQIPFLFLGSRSDQPGTIFFSSFKRFALGSRPSSIPINFFDQMKMPLAQIHFSFLKSFLHRLVFTGLALVLFAGHFSASGQFGNPIPMGKTSRQPGIS